mgnify:CR=1 FL=1
MSTHSNATNSSLFRNTLAVAISGLFAVSGNAAGLVLEEVMVTAQKRVESLQDVPVSVSALSGEKINDAGIQRIEDLSAYIPNFTMTESAVGNVAFIRGIGSGINQGFEQSVGMFVDGIYAGRSQQFRAPFLDVALVEVLKGPQGTLFGKNTIAGAVNITTAKPTDEFEASISALYEPEHGEQELSLVVSGPLSDTVSGRLAVRKATFDGYLKNTISGKDEANRDEEIIRATLRWTPADDLEVLAKFETGSFDVEGRTIQVSSADGVFAGKNLGDEITAMFGDKEDGIINDTKASRGFDPEVTNTEYDNVTITVNYDMGEHTLTSITGYSSYDFFENGDVDFTALALLDNSFDQQFDQFSQELRITSPQGETFEYIAGLYYQQTELDNLTQTPTLLAEVGIGAPGFNRNRTFAQETDTWAAFFQSTWSISDTLRLTTGLRYSSESKEAQQALYNADFRTNTVNPALDGVSGAILGSVVHDYDEDRSEDNLTPAVNLQYDFTPDIMVYASATKGFKGGGYNEAESSGIVERFEYDEEEATAFELGSKMSLLDGAAELNTAIFYTEYKDRQVSAFEGVSFVVGNAAQSTTKGIEMDGRWQATEQLILRASMAYLDSTFDDFQGASCTADQTLAAIAATGSAACTQDLSGEVTEFAPEWSGNISAEYVVPVSAEMDLTFQVDGNYSDSYFFAQDLDENESQDAYTKWNARIQLSSTDDRWAVAIVGKNLTDEDVVSHGNDIPLFRGAHFAFLERSRSIALQGTLRF